MGFSFSHLLVVLVIIVLLFGTGKLRSLGTDLGAAIKGFRKAVSDDEANKDQPRDDTAQNSTSQSNPSQNNPSQNNASQNNTQPPAV